MSQKINYDKFIDNVEFMLTYDNKLKEKIEFFVNDFKQLQIEQNTDTPDMSFEDILNKIELYFKSLSKEYKRYQEAPVDINHLNSNACQSASEFYKSNNDNQYYLSVDLASANWQSINHVFQFDKTYEEFIESFTNYEILKHSKYFRAKLGSMLGQNETFKWNKALLRDKIDNIKDFIMNYVFVNLENENIVGIFADEIIFKIKKQEYFSFNDKSINDSEKMIEDYYGIKVHLEPFYLHNIKNTKIYCKAHLSDYSLKYLSKDKTIMYEKIKRNVELKTIDFEGLHLSEEKAEVLTQEIHEHLEEINQIYKNELS